MKTFLDTPLGAVAAAAALTGVVLVESTVAPYAPFFWGYAVLALALPLWLGAGRWGRFGPALAAAWRPALVALGAVIVIDVILVGRLWDRVLDHIGREADPFWSLRVAVEAMLEKAASMLGIGVRPAQGLFAFFVGIWAPVGEELFYRGYLQGALRKRLPAGAAIAVASFFFALRHGTHLCYLSPGVPWGASIIWMMDAFVIGVIMGRLYERTGSLWPCIAVHFFNNALTLALG